MSDIEQVLEDFGTIYAELDETDRLIIGAMIKGFARKVLTAEAADAVMERFAERRAQGLPIFMAEIEGLYLEKAAHRPLATSICVL